MKKKKRRKEEEKKKRRNEEQKKRNPPDRNRSRQYKVLTELRYLSTDQISEKVKEKEKGGGRVWAERFDGSGGQLRLERSQLERE